MLDWITTSNENTGMPADEHPVFVPVILFCTTILDKKPVIKKNNKKHAMPGSHYDE